MKKKVNKSRVFLSWGIFLFWAALIFFFSSQGSSDSSELSGGIMDFINQILPFSISLHITRKIAHFTEFFILGLCTINLLNCYQRVDKKTLLYALVFCFCYACSDEIHQIFVEGRGPSIIDVCIDTSGSLVSILIILGIQKYKKRKKAYNKNR
ncbi:MAG: VanZ family protein [Bacilli bacterium]|nr:VanZ family protein [Bacilli bacterium]